VSTAALVSHSRCDGILSISVHCKTVLREWATNGKPVWNGYLEGYSSVGSPRAEAGVCHNRLDQPERGIFICWEIARRGAHGEGEEGRAVPPANPPAERGEGKQHKAVQCQRSGGTKIRQIHTDPGSGCCATGWGCESVFNRS
jgi:hypothetical protein